MPELTFEEAFAQLDQIVQRLEGGELSLDEALALYEQGRSLAQQCQAKLDEAELRLTQVEDERPTQPQIPGV
jgi:exodeoxyribonuclease VII small subunit